jgi:hypothetical protein
MSIDETICTAPPEPVLKNRRVKKPSEPARKVVTRSKGRNLYYYASFKNRVPIACESQLEFRACALFEFSPAVKSYKEQPFKVRFMLEGKYVSYTPDFQLEGIADRPLVIEVKPYRFLAEPENKERFIKASAAINKEGYDFAILTEHEIYQPNFATNLTILKHYLPEKLTANEVYLTLNWLKTQESVRIFQLVRFMGCRQKAHAFIALGHAAIDLRLPLANSSQVTLNKENHNETCLFSGRCAPSFEKC